MAAEFSMKGFAGVFGWKVGLEGLSQNGFFFSRRLFRCVFGSEPFRIL